MDTTHKPNDEQAALWNGLSGRAWVDAQELLDHILQPLEDLLLDEVPAGSGGRALDVGCGTGGTTLAVARRLGAGGRCVGVDLSEPMLALARTRAERDGAQVSFIEADAQVHPFEPASFDVILSRFGVMFFDDFVQAFANLRRAARDDGLLRCITWRSPAENAFFTAPERAAAPLLPSVPARRPGGPGQFALADPGLMRRILEDSGWADIDLRPIDVACTLPANELARYVTRLGPIGRALVGVDEPLRTQVVEAVLAACAPWVHGDEVRLTAACWMVGARARR